MGYKIIVKCNDKFITLYLVKQKFAIIKDEILLAFMFLKLNSYTERNLLVDIFILFVLPNRYQYPSILLLMFYLLRGCGGRRGGG